MIKNLFQILEKDKNICRNFRKEKIELIVNNILKIVFITYALVTEIV